MSVGIVLMERERKTQPSVVSRSEKSDVPLFQQAVGQNLGSTPLMPAQWLPLAAASQSQDALPQDKPVSPRCTFYAALKLGWEWALIAMNVIALGFFIYTWMASKTNWELCSTSTYKPQNSWWGWSATYITALAFETLFRMPLLFWHLRLAAIGVRADEKTHKIMRAAVALTALVGAIAAAVLLVGIYNHTNVVTVSWRTTLSGVFTTITCFSALVSLRDDIPRKIVKKFDLKYIFGVLVALAILFAFVITWFIIVQFVRQCRIEGEVSEHTLICIQPLPEDSCWRCCQDGSVEGDAVFVADKLGFSTVTLCAAPTRRRH